MDEITANKFIASLVKSVQALCNGYIDFSSSIEVIGHIHLNIDHKVRLDYVLTEEVSKSVSEDATLFSSHSYHSQPPAALLRCNSTEKLEKAAAATSSSRNHSRRKSRQIPRVDDSESFTFATTVAQVTSPAQINSNSVGQLQADKRLDSSSADHVSISHESKSGVFQGSEEESSQTGVGSVFRSLDRRRKHSTSSFLDSTAKHRRISEVDTQSESSVPVEVIHIKEEPEDDALMYQSSSSEVSGQDRGPAADFSDMVMESLDAVDQKEVTSCVGGDPEQQMAYQPYPVMLHATQESCLSTVSLSPPPINTPPVPSTSTDVNYDGEKIHTEKQMIGACVQTPYTLHKPVKTDSWGKKSNKRRRKTNRGSSRAARKRSSGSAHRPGTSDKSNYLEYTPEDMNEAIELIHGGMSVIDAGLMYGIPRATLFNRSRDGCKTHSGRCSEVFLRTHVGPDYTKKRVKTQYTVETMEKAIEAVHNGMPVIDAAIMYDIPRASLFIRSGKGCPTHVGRCSTVSTNGKLKRTKVSRFRYLQLMQQKSDHKSTSTSVDSSDISESSSPAKLPSIKTEEVSQLPAKYNPKVKLLKITRVAASQPVSKIVVLRRVGPSTNAANTGRPETSKPVFQMSTPAPDLETSYSAQVSDPALESDVSVPPEPVFETLSGNLVVKIEKDSDD